MAGMAGILAQAGLITVFGMALHLVVNKVTLHLVGTPNFNSWFLLTPTFPHSSPYVRDLTTLLSPPPPTL